MTMGDNEGLSLVASGEHSVESMFSSAETENTLIAWGLRFAGLILMFVGFFLVMAPLATLASIIPFLGSIVGAGAGIISFLLTTVIGGSIIVIAWFVYRPWLTAILVFLVAGLIYWAKQRSKAREADRPAYMKKTAPQAPIDGEGG